MPAFMMLVHELGSDSLGHSSQVYTSQIHSASVNSLSFAPHELGLILASASSDGSIGIISMTEDSSFQEERVSLQYQQSFL